MSFSLSGSKSKSKSETDLDSQLKSTLYGNVNRAQNLADTSQYNALSANNINQYMNPYTDSVVNALQGDYAKTAANRQNQIDSSAQAAGAFGGSRHGIASGVASAEGENDLNTMLAQLRASGYNTALGAAQAENTAANNYPLLLQQMLNQSIGLIPQYGTTKSSGSQIGASAGFTYGGAG